MTQRDSALFKAGWISLAIIGLAILVFGLITALMPASSGPRTCERSAWPPSGWGSSAS
jgi:hypothetical protein